MSVERFSSRRERLDRAFLAKRLANARSYRRIAGYFRSSIFELVGEEIAAIPDVRIVCNSELDAADVMISKAVREQSLKELWNRSTDEAASVGVEALLQRDRYLKLYELLRKGNVKIRVVPKDKVFLHGKAGIIEGPDGTTCFLGSINETRNAFANNYEILWEDRSPEGVKWVEEEFEALWAEGKELPEAIIEEIGRVADRTEVKFESVRPAEVPAAALAETPIYRGGEQLQPWQRAFVAMFLEHREVYGRARFLLADEVGLGKTLSLATAAMVGALVGDGPVLIVCPSTLTLQWQVELKDRLGIPSAVWHSSKKVWIDPDGHFIKTRGPEDVTRCPFQVAIISNGLIFHQSAESEHLLGRRYGTVVLDEAHKARRRGGVGEAKDEPNNLLRFMRMIACKTEHLLLGTATPIQTSVSELWDLMSILNSGADFVLGRGWSSKWADQDVALSYIKGDQGPADAEDAWEFLRNPLPPGREHHAFATLRTQLEIEDQRFFSDRGFGGLGPAAQMTLETVLEPDFYRQHNPVIRHTVLRRRQTLEDQGLLEKVAVDVHPEPSAAAGTYSGVAFSGLGLLTNHPFDLAYQAAEEFTRLLGQRTRSAGFMRSLLLQRICSSFASGRSTATKMLGRELIDDEEDAQDLLQETQAITTAEAAQLKIIVEELGRAEARDPKLDAVKYFLTEHKSAGKTWLELGCIVFSQYYDTARWVGEQLAATLRGEPIGVYAGAGKSGVFRDGEFVSAERNDLKTAVKRRELRLLVATDAACEGLNLQTLGTLINVDLPWNPSRLEQRLGRIKRFGQARRTVDMLNLVYHETRDEDVYMALSRRMKDRFDIFGGLPDVIEADWIESQQTLEEQMDRYMHLRQRARDVFEMKYAGTINPDANRWELCSRVLSRQDVSERLARPW
jgi:superfamily II DNA or RNA helicase